MENKYLYVCHAELNAVLNSERNDLHGCRMYVLLFPCHECAKVIIQSGITEIIYDSDKYQNSISYVAAKRMFDLANISYRKFPYTMRFHLSFLENNEK